MAESERARETLVGEKGRVERLRHHTARDVLLFPGSRHLLLVGRPPHVTSLTECQQQNRGQGGWGEVAAT